MKSTLRLASLACLLLGGNYAAAQRVGDPAPEIGSDDSDSNRRNQDEQITLERYRGRIVVLVFWRSNDVASIDVFPLLNKIHNEQRSKGVVIFALTREAENDAKEVLDGKDFDFRVLYDKGDAFNAYKVPGPPYAFVIDPKGIISWTGSAEDNLEDRILACRQKTPPVGSDSAALRSQLAKAKRLFDEREYGKAYTLVKDLADVLDEGDDLGERARALKEQIEQTAEKWLEEAKEARRTGDHESACRIAAEITVRLDGTDVAHDADDLVARLRAERKTKEMMRTARKNAQGQMALDKAAEFEATKQYLEAREAYEEVLAKFPETDAGKQAQDAVDRIKSDPLIQQHIRKWRAESQAQRWLDLGDRFARVEMHDLAREWYDKVIKEHPTSLAATRAKERLKDLPRDTAGTRKKPAGGG